ncbi:hypothetical protein E4U54_000619 [Claviceps lovelessii]|nr:hypothetical protein E4U54_000619 [Claviceps lovelessii]
MLSPRLEHDARLPRPKSQAPQLNFSKACRRDNARPVQPQPTAHAAMRKPVFIFTWGEMCCKQLQKLSKEAWAMEPSGCLGRHEKRCRVTTEVEQSDQACWILIWASKPTYRRITTSETSTARGSHMFSRNSNIEQGAAAVVFVKTARGRDVGASEGDERDRVLRINHSEDLSTTFSVNSRYLSFDSEFLSAGSEYLLLNSKYLLVNSKYLPYDSNFPVLHAQA